MKTKQPSNRLRLWVRVFLLLSFVFLANDGKSQSFPYRFSYLTVDEGLSHTDANDIAQDKKGYIWVGTFFGLDRYDGYDIKRYYNRNESLNNAFKNRITCITPDKQGNIWLGTEAGIQCFDAKTESYIDYTDPNENRPILKKIFKSKDNILFGLCGDKLKIYGIKGRILQEKKFKVPQNFKCSDMTADQNGTLFITSNIGLWILNEKGLLKKVVIQSLNEENLSRVYFDTKNNLVVTAQDRMLVTSAPPTHSSSAERHFTLVDQFTVPDHKSIKNLARKGNSDYYINTGSNLYRVDQNLNLIQNLKQKNSQNNLNSNSLSTVFIDRSECLWVCTFGGGVNYLDLNEKLFYTLQHNPENSNSLSGNHIRSVLADRDEVWIGTTASGLNLYNLKTQNFTHFNSFNSKIRLNTDEISALALDNEHNLWIGSSGGIQILKTGGKELIQPSGYENFPKYIIETFAKDYYGNIWFGNHSDRFGVIWKDQNNRYQVKYFGVGYFIFADKNRPQLFISSTTGLKRITVDPKGNILEESNYTASEKLNSLSSNYTYPIVKQNDNTYWVGTIGGGLNLLKLKKGAVEIKRYNDKYGIFNDVESMEIDGNGNVWMGGNGLEKFSPVTEQLIRYDKKDGLQGNSFKVGSSFKGADGRLYFGGINGLNYFMPAQITSNKIPATPLLTDILVNNSKPSYNLKDSAEAYIKNTISYSKKISLNYLQNNFEIFFSAMHFANPLKCRYRYKLEGFDKKWKYTDGKNPSAAYNNLDYGSYSFVLEASNNDDIWSKSSSPIIFEITPPWWKSGYAKSFYTLLILSSLIGIYIYQARWYRLKREIELRALNEEKREEMHKQKEELYQQQLMFFTNISHEFRTPLTLILGPLESLIDQNKDLNLNGSYQLMLKNAKRLINLISELMNFKKVADSVIKLQVQPVNISRFCEELVSDFNNLSIAKDIQFKMLDYTNPDNHVPVMGWFDVQILEKILFNLLNNSFKYTENGGIISIEIALDPDHLKPKFNKGFKIINKDYRSDNYMFFRITDSGIGISEDSISSIFERYYRISTNHLGSGVGLALVKSLTLLHKGHIEVFSEKNKGTEIVIAIPWKEHSYSILEKADKNMELLNQLEPIDNSVQIPLIDLKGQHRPDILKGRKSILLVDDNKELRTFLVHLLEPYYNIFEAEDGMEAIEIATEKVPDLIISDVMMPKMDGLELCKIMKERFETSHIPFVILSAKDALNSKIEGMELGADYYFAKPLSTELLLLTVKNIFDQREKLKQHYNNNYLSEATELVQSEKDKEFLSKLIKLIEANIQKVDLDVDYLCDQMFSSRTKLYRKIKGITDQSVGEFIRTIRLKKAIQIMTHEDVAINEVADRIGLQSSSNFSRAFKREYGKSPMQFMQSLKNEQNTR
jgi:signal transduction histidine kinase/DNA-binding response OmpR family regulator/ligand-binding sensor domain-containing protein